MATALGERQLLGVRDDEVAKQTLRLCCAEALTPANVAIRKMARRILSSLLCFESWSNPLRIPGVSFLASFPEPCVERVVDHEAMSQLLVVVLKKSRKSQGYRQQPGALGLGVKSLRVGPANDARELGKGGIFELILVDECVETTARAVVG
jgi:hypothetical protein